MAQAGRAADEAGIEFFEKRIRPVLVERCYECHNSRDKREGGLALDHREGLLQGGDSGEAVVAGKPDESLLISAIDHSSAELRMPQGGPKLSAAVIADFAKWIKLGAPDPRDTPPSAEELSAVTSWEAVRERRKQWWSFQQVVKPEAPATGAAWSDHPIDRFLFAAMERAQASPAAPADRRSWCGRSWPVDQGRCR
ncbi:MAG TPA: c-type cytochrome domain-containing protein [Pirellulales bacterium]|nr:c-type cytochrome domain-containing protein [Pirellulales bacterium]